MRLSEPKVWLFTRELVDNPAVRISADLYRVSSIVNSNVQYKYTSEYLMYYCNLVVINLI